MRYHWYYFGAVLFGVITGIDLLLDFDSTNMVICGLEPGIQIIRDLKQAVITATLGVIHLWLVYCWAIRAYRSEVHLGFMRTMAVLPLSPAALTSVTRYVVMLAVAC